MSDCDPQREAEFFELFRDYFDSEKDAAKQHDPANYSLDRMTPLAEAAGNPQAHLRVIHIAGTKGKGTTSTYIASLLSACGKNAGLFTSPHVRTVRERFQFNGELISYDLLFAKAQELLAAICKAELFPSLFEIFTVLFWRICADLQVDFVVQETGIGGRLDATNFIAKPQITVITPISYDHVALLENDIRSIATEKAGILKEDVPLVLARQPYSEAEETILSIAKARHCPVVRPDDGFPQEFLPAGTPAFLRENFAVAWTTLRSLGLTPDLSRYHSPAFRARFEWLPSTPSVMLDGAHNGDSMRRLVDALLELYPNLYWTVVLGCVQGKDIPRILQELARLKNAQFFLVNPRTEKGSALQELIKLCPKYGISVREIIPELTSKTQLPLDRPILFTGSFFTATIGDSLFRTS